MNRLKPVLFTVTFLTIAVWGAVLYSFFEATFTEETVREEQLMDTETRRKEALPEKEQSTQATVESTSTPLRLEEVSHLLEDGTISIDAILEFVKRAE